MSRYSLRCRACRTPSTLADAHACAECLGPLEVTYDHELTGEALRGGSE